MAVNQLWQRVRHPILIFIVGVSVVFAVVSLRPKPEPLPEEPPLIPEVTVIKVTPAPAALTVKTQGTVEPRREIDLVSQVAGKVQLTNAEFVDGGFFNQAETLVEIDPRDYQFALVRAEARVKEAEQALATEKGRARQAKREWRELGNPEANALFLRIPQLAAAKANLASARAERDQARLDLERTGISVPFTGRIRSTHVDIGQYVSPGTLIAKVYDTSVAEIRLPLTDRQVALVELPLGFRGNHQYPGPKVTVHGVIAGKKHVWSGRIVRTDASVDTRSRLYYAVAEIENPFTVSPDSAQMPLVVGLFVEAEISGREIPDVIQLPKQALYKSDRILYLDENNRVRSRTVQVLQFDQGFAWVKGDFTDGDQVILDQQSYLSEGVAVRVAPATEQVPSTGSMVAKKKKSETVNSDEENRASPPLSGDSSRSDSGEKQAEKTAFVEK